MFADGTPNRDCVDSKRADFFLAARHAALRVSNSTINPNQDDVPLHRITSRLRRAKEKVLARFRRHRTPKMEDHENDAPFRERPQDRRRDG